MNDKKIDINEYSKNFPNSEKIYTEGSKANIRVPSRMIKQTPTKLNNTIQLNEPIYVYDTTGAYTDPGYKIDVSSGLKKTRKQWIEQRGDTEVVNRSYLDNLKVNFDNAEYEIDKTSCTAKSGKNVTQIGAMAKLFASEACVKVANEAVQIHGGYGFTKDFPVEKFLRDSKLCTIGEGTSEIQKVVISRNLLK